ncbi:MAG: hypothetical protein AAFU60_02885 [Bacteroidota bacterium]
MSQREFENRIRESLSDHRSAMDTDRFFQAIKRKERRRRWFIFGWISTASASVLLLGLGGLWFNGYFESKLASTTGTKHEVYPTQIPNGQPFEENLPQRTSPLTVVRSDHATENNLENPAPPSTSQMKTTVNFGGASLTKTTSVNKEEMGYPVFKAPSLSAVLSKTQEAIQPETEILSSTPSLETEQKPLEPFSLLRTLPTPALDQQAAKVISPNLQQKGQWSLVFQSGAGLLLRSYQGDGTNETEYQTARKVETNLETLDLSAAVRWKSHKGLVLQLAAGAAQSTTRLNWDEPFQTSFIDEDAVLRIIQFPDGTTEEERGPQEVTQTGLRHVVHFNAHRSLDLRFQAGYQWTQGDWALIGLTGASWAWWQESTGRVLIGDHIPEYQQNLSNQLAWESQIGLQYQWIQPLAFELSAFHKAPLNALDYQGQGWAEYRHITGLRLGIQYTW